MSKMKLIFTLAFVLVFAAGAVLGVALDRSLGRRGRRSRLARSLDLTPRQQQRMREIWSETLKEAREQMDGRREQLREQRRREIRQLLTEAQKQEYDAIMRRYEQGQEELRESRKALFEEARQQTRRMLEEKQREKYDELMEKRMKDWGRRPGRHRDGRERSPKDPEAP